MSTVPPVTNSDQFPSPVPGRGWPARDLLFVYLAPSLLWAGIAVKVIVVSHQLECCGPIERAPVTASIAGVLYLAVPTLWLRSRGRLLAAIALNLLLTLWLVADLVHGRFYGDPTSVSELIHAWQLPSVSSSIIAALHTADAWYFADLGACIVLASAAARLRIPNGPAAPRRLRLSTAMLAVGLTVPAMGLVLRDPDGVFEFANARRQVVYVVGIAGYHFYDLVTYVRYRMLGRWGIADSDIQSAARQLLQSHRATSPHVAPLWGAARGANLIIIQAESLMAFPMDIEIDGQAVTPNLRALALESLWAQNFFDQAAQGSTADAAFGVLQSLHPLESGAVATRYATNRYYALPSILKERGTDTVALTGAPGEFWNMRQFLESLGFARTCLDCPALPGLHFGQGLADGDFFRDVIPELRTLREPFFAFLMTQTNHHPYVLPESLDPMPVGRLAGTLIGRYLQSVHYFDQSLGQFRRALAETGLLDRSVLVVYGDHRGYLGSPPELPQLLHWPPDLPLRQWELNRRLPLMIRLPHAVAAGIRTRPVGHLDVAPTALELLGIEAQSSVMQGHSLFDDRPPLVVFRDGGFVSDGAYVLTQPDPTVDTDDRRAAAGCYDPATGGRIECAPFAGARRAAADELRLSDLILRGDLIPRLLDRLRTARAQALSSNTPK